MAGWCCTSAQALSVTWLSAKRNSVLTSFAVVVLWWASGLTCWLGSETISTFNLSIDREEAVVFV